MKIINFRYSRNIRVLRPRMRQQTPISRLEDRRRQMNGITIPPNLHYFVHAQVLQLFQYQLIVVRTRFFVFIRLYASYIPGGENHVYCVTYFRTSVSLRFRVPGKKIETLGLIKKQVFIFTGQAFRQSKYYGILMEFFINTNYKS